MPSSPSFCTSEASPWRSATAPGVPLYRKALTIRGRAPGADSLEIAETLDGLSRALRNIDRPDSAVTLARRALAIHRRRQDSTHPDVVEAQHTLAYALRAKGQYEKGAARYRSVLKKERARYGPDHARLAGTHNDFAFLLKKQERYAAAARHYRKAIDISSSVYGPIHPRTMMYRRNLAGTLMEKEAYAEVEHVLRANLKALREHAPNDSARLRSARGTLGQFFAERGRFAKAPGARWTRSAPASLRRWPATTGSRPASGRRALRWTSWRPCVHRAAHIRRELDIDDGDKLRWTIEDDGTLRVRVVQQRRGTFSDFDGYDGDERTDVTTEHDAWGVDAE